MCCIINTYTRAKGGKVNGEGKNVQQNTVVQADGLFYSQDGTMSRKSTS